MWNERLRIDSIASLNKILRVVKKQKQSPGEQEIRQLWSDVMNYTMTTNSADKPKPYLRKIRKVLSDQEGSLLLKESEKVLNQRFKIKTK